MGQCPRPPRRSDPAAWARVVSTVKKRVLAAHFQALECMARARERQIPKLYINCGSSSRLSDRSEKVRIPWAFQRPGTQYESKPFGSDFQCVCPRVVS